VIDDGFVCGHVFLTARGWRAYDVEDRQVEGFYPTIELAAEALRMKNENQ